MLIPLSHSSARLLGYSGASACHAAKQPTGSNWAYFGTPFLSPVDQRKITENIIELADGLIEDAGLSLTLPEPELQRILAKQRNQRRLQKHRAYLARAQIRTDQARVLRDDTLAAITAGRPDTMLRVLEVKASAAEAALEVTDTAMRICGGAAFRKDVGIERLFRDARAASIMAPTSDVLYDFIGNALCDAVAPKE